MGISKFANYGNGADLNQVEFLRDNKLPNFPSPERAIRVIAHMAAYEEYKVKLAATKVIKAEPIGNIFEKNSVLTEPQAMTLLKENGITVPEFRFVQNRADIGTACTELGYPVVIKVVSPQIIHKSECGGVKLNIKNNQEAESAFDAMAIAAKNKDFHGVIAYSMLQAGREVLVGFTRDKQFGPVVVFGMGGIYTEVMKDIVLAIAPVNKTTAMEMIKKIKSYPILKGTRGQKPADIDAIAETIAAFSQLPFLYPDLAEADLNPVFVFEKGAIAADVRLLGRKKD